MARTNQDLVDTILAKAAAASKKAADAVAKQSSRIQEMEEMIVDIGTGIGKRSNEESESETASNPNPTQQQGQQQEPRQRRGAGIFKIGGLFLLLTLYLFFSYRFVLPTLCLHPNYQQLSLPTHHIETIDQIQPTAMSSTEQTFIAIKPDGVQRGLIGPIISRFENRGYKLAAIKLVQPGKEHLEKHYADLKDKPFFAGLVEYMNSGPICAMVWEGRDAVKTGRVLLGATNPLASAPGTIRGDYSIDVGRNVCHGSDSVENAKKEPQEVQSWTSALKNWVYEKN